MPPVGGRPAADGHPRPVGAGAAAGGAAVAGDPVWMTSGVRWLVHGSSAVHRSTKLAQFLLLIREQIAEDSDQDLQCFLFAEPRVLPEVAAHALELKPQLSPRLHGP